MMKVSIRNLGILALLGMLVIGQVLTGACSPPEGEEPEKNEVWTVRTTEELYAETPCCPERTKEATEPGFTYPWKLTTDLKVRLWASEYEGWWTGTATYQEKITEFTGFGFITAQILHKVNFNFTVTTEIMDIEYGKISGNAESTFELLDWHSFDLLPGFEILDIEPGKETIDLGSSVRTVMTSDLTSAGKIRGEILLQHEGKGYLYNYIVVLRNREGDIVRLPGSPWHPPWFCVSAQSEGDGPQKIEIKFNPEDWGVEPPLPWEGEIQGEFYPKFECKHIIIYGKPTGTVPVGKYEIPTYKMEVWKKEYKHGQWDKKLEGTYSVTRNAFGDDNPYYPEICDVSIWWWQNSSTPPSFNNWMGCYFGRIYESPELGTVILLSDTCVPPSETAGHSIIVWEPDHGRCKRTWIHIHPIREKMHGCIGLVTGWPEFIALFEESKIMVEVKPTLQDIKQFNLEYEK